MLIRVLNHFFAYGTPLNTVLSSRSHSKYNDALRQLQSEYQQRNQALPKRFVIFNFPRSGSNFLCTMLNNHPDILCHQELFNPGRIFYARDFHTLLNGGSEEGATPWEDLIYGKGDFSTKGQRDLDPEKFLMRIWQHSYDYRAVGFNLFPTHVPNMAPSLWQDEEVKKILLIRKNKVKSYVSRAIARKTNVWADYSNKSSKPEKTKQPTVKVNVQNLISWSRKYDEYFQYLRCELDRLGQPFFEVTYEELVGESSDYVKERMLDFIGIPPKVDTLQPLNKRQSSKKLSALVSNYDELEKGLKGTELEVFL